MTYGQKVVIGLAVYAAMFLFGFYGAMSAAQPANDAPPDSFPGLARDLLPLCERAEALRQEADEGDAPPAEMKLLCDTADGLWRIYHELKEVHYDR